MEQTNPQPPSPTIDSMPTIPPTLSAKDKIKDLFQRAYKHKLTFWSLATLFSLIVVIMIAGTIFKLTQKGNDNSKPKISPTPITVTTNNNEQAKPLDLAEVELNKIKLELDNLDIFQKKLQPPVTDFKVDF